MQFRSHFAAWLGTMSCLCTKLMFMASVLLLGRELTTCVKADGPQGPGSRGVVLNIDAMAPRVSVNSRMYGVFFEEINHAGDGGLYGELVQNRDFEAHDAPTGGRFNGNAMVTPKGWFERVWFNTDVHAWTLLAEGGAKGSIRLVDSAPLNSSNPHSMRLVARKVGDRLGVANQGYWGMNFREGALYDLSFYARTEGDERFSWPVNLIEFDTVRSVGRTSYHVQKLFSSNRPDEVLKTTVEGQSGTRDVFALAGIDHKNREVIIKVVNHSGEVRQVTVRSTGLNVSGSTAHLTTLGHQDPTAENTLDDPDVVVPVASQLSGIGEGFTLTLPPHSLTIARYNAIPAR